MNSATQRSSGYQPILRAVFQDTTLAIATWLANGVAARYELQQQATGEVSVKNPRWRRQPPWSCAGGLPERSRKSSFPQRGLGGIP